MHIIYPRLTVVAYSFSATVNVSSRRCFMERQEGVDILGAFCRAVRKAAESPNRHTLHKSDDCGANEFLLLKASGNFKLITAEDLVHSKKQIHAN